MLHPAPNSQNLELNHELLNLDHANKGHRPDGKFMSNQEMEMIAAHQDEIQGSLGDYQVAKQSAEWSTDAEKLTQKYNDAVKRADELEQEANARKTEQSDEIKTDWKTTPEYAAELFQQVLRKTSDLEQRLESGRSNKNESESQAAVESPTPGEYDSLEARLRRVREGHKQLDELEQQLNANHTDTSAIEVKKDDFTEEHKHKLNRHLEEDKWLEKQWRSSEIDPADVVEADDPEVPVLAMGDTQELPAQAADAQADKQATPTSGRFRVSLKKVSSRITTAMQKAYTEVDTRITNYLNDEKGGWDRAERRKTTAFVGMILGASAISLAMKYGVDLDWAKGGGGSVDALVPNDPNTGVLDAQLDLVPAAHQMEAGDNLWNLSVADLNAQGIDVSSNNPADLALIDAVTDKTAEINNFANPDNLPVGTEVRKLSPEEIEELVKQYKR